MPALTIREIKEDILQRARLRQAGIERGAYDVPLRYSPLPLANLLDLLSQLEYRQNSLELAVPPPHRALRERLKRFFKNFICKCFRWLLIRQVEFNTVAVQHAQEAAQLLALADRHQGDFTAALIALRLQVNSLAQRIARLEGAETRSELLWDTVDGGQEILADKNKVWSLYLRYLKDHAPLLVIGCDRGDFLKLLVSEGIAAEGIEANPLLAEYCRERELPVTCSEPFDYLGQLSDGCLGGIYLGGAVTYQDPRQLFSVLGRCWNKLAKGGLLIAEIQAHPLPVEMLSFLLEQQSFAILDSIFSMPTSAEAAEVVETRTGLPFDRKQYRGYAVVGRK